MDIWSAISHLYAERFDVLDAYMNDKQSAWERGDIDDLELQAAFCLDGAARADLVLPARKWAQAYPSSYAAHQVLANLLLSVGWRARGDATVDVTVQLRFDEMQKHFNEAAKHIELAFDLSTSPILTLRLWSQIFAAGEYPLDDEGRQRQFESFLPKSAVLCGHWLWRLNPKWGGSVKQLDDFFASTREFTLNQAQRNYVESSYLEEKADIQRQSGYSGAALELLEKAHKVRPSASSLQSLGEVHVMRNEYAAAARNFEKSVALAPSYYNYYYLGTALHEIGHMPEATAAFEKALSLGHGGAVWYLAEYALAQNPSAALRDRCEAWFNVGAMQYSSTAMRKKADFLFNGSAGYAKNTALCSQAWIEASAWGDGCSSNNLALSYWDGRYDLPKDYAKAFFFAKAAADVDYEEAYGNLGRMHYLGHGTPVDYAAAFPYLEAGAENDDASAMRVLISALWFGLGTKANQPLARQWLAKLKTIDAEEYKEAHNKVLGLVGRVRGMFSS
jgi:tetratricopeptide (TPR) repeat protein